MRRYWSQLGLGLLTWMAGGMVGSAQAQTALATPAPTLMVLAYHDVAAGADRGQDPDAITPDTLIAQWEWLRGHGWTFVSWAQVQAARDGQMPLPDKSVLLTFDDGLASVYTEVYPLLQAYRAPAAIALVNTWMNLPPQTTITYNGRTCDRTCFVSWDQVRAMEHSGLVTVWSHSAALHGGVVANRQGNTEPSATTWQVNADQPETSVAHRARLQADLQASQHDFETHLGHRVSAIAWPYGAYNAEDVRLAQNAGMVSLGLSATGPVTLVSSLLERRLISHDVDLQDWVGKLAHPPPEPRRAMVVAFQDLDGPSPMAEAHLGRLIQRAKDLGVGEVWLSDPWALTQDRTMRWNRIVWQLHTRAGVKVGIVWPDSRPLNLKEVATLSRTMPMATLIVPGWTTLAQQQQILAVLKAWRPGADLQVRDPKHGVLPNVGQVQSHPPTNTAAYYWVPTRPTSEAGERALWDAALHGHNRLVYATTDWLDPSSAWTHYKPGLSLSGFPYRRP